LIGSELLSEQPLWQQTFVVPVHAGPPLQWHTPFWHNSPGLQTMPQPPQLLAFPLVFVQETPPTESWQQADPAPHSGRAPHEHCPFAAHVSLTPHEPQLGTVRCMPQLSGSLSGPQSTAKLRQNCVSLSGTHPQTLAVCAPQMSGAAQLPQVAVRLAPQLSLAVNEPQFFPYRVQNCASVSGVHTGLPHTLATVAPHVCGGVHVPQLAMVRTVPQESVATMLPQSFPLLAQRVASDSWTQASAAPSDASSVDESRALESRAPASGVVESTAPESSEPVSGAAESL
jgi:hypothetical protein